MVVHRTEVINMCEYYFKHYISGRDLNTRGKGRVCVSIPFYKP